MDFRKKLFVIFLLLTISAPSVFADSGDDLFKFGMNLYQNGKYAGAVKVFTNYLKKYTDSDFTEEATYFLGSSFIELQEYREAKELLTELFYTGNKVYLKEETLYKIIIILAGLGDHEQIKENLEIFRKKFPNSAYINKLKKLDFIKSDDALKKESIQKDDFEELAKKIMDRENIPIDSAYYFLGLDLQQKDASEKSEYLYTIFLQKFPKSIWYYNAKYMLSLVLVQKKAYKTAIVNLKEIYLDTPDIDLKINSLYLIAEINISTGRIDEAEKYYRMISEDYKNSPLAEDSYYMLGEILKKQGKEKESASVFSTIVGLRNEKDNKKAKVETTEVITEKLPKSVTEKIKKLMREKNYSQALKEIDFSTQTYGLKPEFNYLKGNIFQLMSRYKEAISQYELYMNATHDSSVYSILGYLYYVIGNYNKSITFYKKIISEVKDSKRIRDAKYAIKKIKKKI